MMSDEKSSSDGFYRWSWDVAGFEPRLSPAENDDHHSLTPPTPLVRRYSISPSSISSYSELSKHAKSSGLLRLKNKIKLVREDYAELRQEASDLQEYCNAKLDRVTRYLGVLADKTRRLDQAALDTETRISPLISEKKGLFNKLLTAKGNVQVFCRVRPLFEDEGSSVVEFPDSFTVRVNTGDDSSSNPKKDFEFDRVYGPHVGQVDLFNDIQPFVQSAFDGFNVCIFAYGQTHSGKTHTMEGSSHDRGLYARCFEELFDLSNSDATSTSNFSFSVSLFELYNEQIRDLLLESGRDRPKIGIRLPDCVVELVQEKVENPLDFSKILKVGFQNRGSNTSKFNATHLIICIHIYYENLITGENFCSKLSLIDLAGSESATIEDDTGLHATEVLYVMKSLSALGDVLNSLTSKKDNVPYGNSMLTKLFSDSLGGDSKTVLVVNLCPNALNLSETLSSLNFSARARSAVLSLGNWDTIKKWREIANDARKELYEKEKIICDLKKEIIGLTQDLKRANDQCVLLFNEVQSAWKVSYTLQSDLKAENIMLVDKHEVDKEQNSLLRSQLAQLLQLEQEQKMQIKQRDSTIQTLQTKIKCLELQLNEALSYSERTLINGQESRPTVQTSFNPSGTLDSTVVTRRLEEELLKRDALIERLHEENEKLFDKLTEKVSLAVSPQVSSSSPKRPTIQNRDVGRNFTNDNNVKGHHLGEVPLPSDKSEESVALVKPCAESIKRTPAGEYLTSALNDFDPAHYDGSLAAISDGANKLLMLVLAAVIKAGASREHEILAEIRDAVFAFIRKMEPRRVMDTMLVSRVRILYIRSLLSRSPELQSIKVSPVERFLEKANTGRSRSSSRGSSPVRSPVRYNSLLDEHIQGFKVNLKPEKKSKISSVVLRIRGIDQDTWRQHVTGGKLREITEEAKSFAVGNKALAALFVHTPAGELQRQIRNWLRENFDFLSVSDDTVGEATGQLDLLSTAIMDGWMAGLGAAMPPDTDALGQLLSEYVKRVFSSQLQHLKDMAGTLSTEVTVDSAQVAKLHSALESVHHKRTKILQQMRRDVALFTLDSPVRSPSTGAEDARLASLVSLDGILRQVKDISRQSRVSSLGRSRKKEMIASLDELTEHMPSLLDIDHPCAQKHIEDARRMLESIPEEDDIVNASSERSADDAVEETEVAQWNVLQFNTGLASPPFIIKCGANSSSELVVKADARVQEPKGSEIMRVVPRPTVLENMSLEEMKQLFTLLPESLSHLALARTADGTRARYSRLYRTLAMKVPALRDLISELEKGGVLRDVRS